MREKVNQEVSVVMYYSAAKKMALPRIIHWQNTDYTIKQMGYIHKIWEGKTLHHIFEFTVKEADLWMRLSMDTSNLHWTLEAVSDGLAT